MMTMTMKMKMHCHGRKGPAALQWDTPAKKHQSRVTGKVNIIIFNTQLLSHGQNLTSLKMTTWKQMKRYCHGTQGPWVPPGPEAAQRTYTAAQIFMVRISLHVS